jgi:hypothetical protein
MKSSLAAIVLLMMFSADSIAQENKYLIGAGGNYNIPVGSLADRFKPAAGGYFYGGQEVSSRWTWIGKLEYYKFTETNKDALVKRVLLDAGEMTREYKFPLTGLELELTVAGASAEARYSILDSDVIEADLNFGFGFYYWEHFRGKYTDSLYADTTGTGDLVLLETLVVPAIRQKDWSGSINFGANFNIRIADPVYLNISGNYKIIIGELWQTLVLDIENVSSLQLFDIRAGILLKL